MFPGKKLTGGVAGTVALLICAPWSTHSQSADPPPPPSLKTIAVPEPPNLNDFVNDRKAAIALGKALFWDMQVASDRVVACASCHFHAGADNRSVNQLNPGLNRIDPVSFTPNPDRIISKGANATLTSADFPLHKLADPNDRNSAIVADTNDVVSSNGVFSTTFVDSVPGSASDVTRPMPDPDGFQVGGVNVRRVEPRNAPTVINAVFNFRNFWDGRAQNVFNGVNALGDRDPAATLYLADARLLLSETHVRLINASLASQAVAPPVNGTEQSADGRTFVDIAQRFSLQLKRGGKKALSLRPLGQQVVAKNDSVLGAHSRHPHAGLAFDSYEQLITQAFQPQWWKSPQFIHINGDGSRTLLPLVALPGPDDYRQIEYNFSLFFGLAIQMYESTLVADDTPFDRYMEGNRKALTDLQKQGLALFLSQTRGRCINCHAGPEFTEASYSIAGVKRIRRREEQLIDTGFFNIGVRPFYEDVGIGATDRTAANLPLSMARQAMQGLFVDPTLSPPVSSSDVLAVDGALKVPGLRNVELTAPYFHNGGQATLRAVVDFYSRGGDFVPINVRDGVITPVRTLNLSDAEKNALVAFLLALTDERVRREQAPFDHPQLFVNNGHAGSSTWVSSDNNGQAVDVMVEIPEVGKNGAKPLKNFLEQ